MYQVNDCTSNSYKHYKESLSLGKSLIILGIALLIICASITLIQYFGRSLHRPVLLLPGFAMGVIFSSTAIIGGISLIASKYKIFQSSSQKYQLLVNEENSER